MILFILEWDNGLDFDDHELTLLGIYASAAIRELACWCARNICARWSDRACLPG